jgi:hypothetical protein
MSYSRKARRRKRHQGTSNPWGTTLPLRRYDLKPTIVVAIHELAPDAKPGEEVTVELTDEESWRCEAYRAGFTDAIGWLVTHPQALVDGLEGIDAHRAMVGDRDPRPGDEPIWELRVLFDELAFQATTMFAIAARGHAGVWFDHPHHMSIVTALEVNAAAVSGSDH